MAAAILRIAGATWAQEQRPGWLGVELQDVTKEEADKLGWEAPRGAKIVRPTEGGPAAEAGLEAGDVVAALDGADVGSTTALISAVTAKAAGTQVRLRLIRNGRERTVTMTLGARPGGLAVADANAPHLVLDAGGHTSIVRGLAFTPDGRRLVSGSQDKTVRMSTRARPYASSGARRGPAAGK